jgi:hypothetical protein
MVSRPFLVAVLAAIALAGSLPARGAEAPDHVVRDADAPPGERDKFLYTVDAPVRWPGTIVWSYNPSGAPAAFSDTATTVARLTAALDKWAAVCAISHSYQGTTATAPNETPGGQPDLANVVGWAALQGSTAGLTWTWYSSPGGVSRLVDGDIILSPAQVTSNAQMDRVAMHEWGHLIGLAHSNMNQTAMSGPPYSSYNNIVTPTVDDVRGCRCLYGPAAGQSSGLLCSLPRALSFGNVPAGASSGPTAVTLANEGNASITLQAQAFTSGGFVATGCDAGTVIAPGQACVLSVSFAPAATTAYAATMSIPVAGQSQPYRIELAGAGTTPSGPTPSLAPASAAFGSQVVYSTSAPKSLVLSNVGGSAFSITGFTLAGATPAAFNRAGSCAIGTTLGAAASCTIQLTFSPVAIGAHGATLDVALSSGSVPQVALSGTGIASPTPPALNVSPSALTFGDQVAGTQGASQNVTVANAGGGTLTVSAATLAGAAPRDFALGGNCTAGRLLSASQSCTASVRFAPAGAGAKSATLVIATCAGTASIALAGNAISPPPVVASTVVEFYHAAYDHYFITIGAEEIAALDTGVFAGWARTGLSFKAHASAQNGFAPICRFYRPPGYGDSHFFSASPAECAVVHAQNPAFQLESTAVMHLAIPDPVTGACPALTDPVYRVWNRRLADTNHRYTASRTVRDEMVAKGFVAEGSGPDVVTFCAPR